jgi:hypothetical protein
VGVFRVPQRGGCGHFGQWPAELVEVELLEPQARLGREEEGRVADGASPVPEAVTRPPELTLPQLLAGLSNGVVPLGGDLGFAVRLPAGLADEKSLRLLATLAPLRELTLTCDPASNEPSAPAIQALQGASGLLSLTLQCCGYLPDGCLEAVGSLQQISSLTLIDAIPREGCTYGYLTNARALRSLAISFPREFGPTEVAALRELLQVQDLRLFRAKPPESHYWPLLKLPGLTNLLVELPASRLEVRRTREDK